MAKEKDNAELNKVMEGDLGARLIELREDAGYDITQMADALCLSEDVITNLENEAFDLLAEPPYVRGYLRNYAKLGNGDEDANILIKRYESLRGADATELDFQIKSSSEINEKSKKRLSPVWSQVIMLGVLIGIIGLIISIPQVNNWISGTWNSLSSKLEPTDPENNPLLTGKLPVPAPLPDDQIANSNSSANNSTAQNTPANGENSGANTGANNNQGTENSATTGETNQANNNDATASNNSQSNNSDSTNTETNSEGNTATSTESTNETASTDANETEVSSDPNGIINIKLVFNKEVWLRIKDKDNKTVFEGLNKASTEKALELNKPLTFRVGNAQGLSLFVDDSAVDISTYINGSIANFTLE